MTNWILTLISKFYNEWVESLCVRILYFFNTINTYFMITGLSSFIIVFKGDVNIIAFALSLISVIATVKIADFHPGFLIFAVPTLILLGIILNIPLFIILMLLVTNIALFFLIQFLFMGIPDSIVARDFRVAFIKMFNSLFTIAPTTVSFSMSVFFSFYLSFFVTAAVSCRETNDFIWITCLGTVLLIGALITRLMHPDNRFSKFHKPDVVKEPLFDRVVMLNIDGVRKDIFDSLNLPTMCRLTKEGTSHVDGLETVYRALTNPAFASIFTGTIPEYHGVRDNNLGQVIRTEGLPDIVPTISYGSMHVKHFCKKSWETRIVSLPRNSVYKSDDIMVDWLKDDMMTRNEIRLFVADFSEADFLAHAYGSTSRHYKEALRRTDARIGSLLDWMHDTGMSNGTAVIICSDHGIAAIDHSYLIAESERKVPFIMYGNGIKKGYKIRRQGKIMDICCTIAYLLGIRYPGDSRGQVFTDALINHDIEAEKEEFVSRFNQIKYDAEAAQYHSEHAEIYEGDAEWWDQCAVKYAMNGSRHLRILDIGCGNGFVGERFIACGVDFSEFVCMDISDNMLESAKRTLGKYPRVFFTTGLDNLNGLFDIITVSSVFHHIVRPEKLAEDIDRLLSGGGIIIGSHEPNREAFRSRLFRAGAFIYKKAGGSISINDEIVRSFNKLLHQKYPNAPSVCREEILQIVEYHSPLEQFDRGVDSQSGFMPDTFVKSCFPEYEILELETYTTFHHRPGLKRHKKIQFLLSSAFSLLFGSGNLFRYVLRKKI